MATTSLPSLFEDSVQRLNALVLSETLLVEDLKLKGLLYAAWMRLMNWKSDIKDEEKATLSKLEGISPQIADIVRGRLISLSGAIQAVESLHLREISGASEEAEIIADVDELSEELPESVNRVFRTAIDIVRTTRVLRRFVDADGMSAKIKSLAALAGLTIKYGKGHDHKEETTSKGEFSEEESLGDIDSAPEPEPGFEVGEQVIMEAVEDEATQMQHFNIRAKRLRENGKWEYQLMAADVTLYLNGEWFEAAVLDPVSFEG